MRASLKVKPSLKVQEVKLAIVDSENKEYSTIQKVLFSESGVVAQISASPTSGEVPLSVEFDGSWSTTSSGQIIDYIIKLKITDGRSLISSVEKKITVLEKSTE